MYTFSGLICAYSLGVLTCLVAVMLGAFIERTSYLLKEKRTSGLSPKPSASYLHLLPVSRFVNK